VTPEGAFRVANTVALAGWIVLVFFGRSRWVSGLLTGLVLPLLLAVAYSAILIAHWGESAGNFSSLAGVSALFANRWLLLAGWIHYLAFDLFIGSWQVRDSIRNRIPYLAVVPCLVLTFLFGPAGLLLYCILRAGLRMTGARSIAERSWILES